MLIASFRCLNGFVAFTWYCTGFEEDEVEGGFRNNQRCSKKPGGEFYGSSIGKVEHRNPVSTTVGKAEHRNPLTYMVPPQGSNTFPNKVIINNYAFGPGMKIRISSKVYGKEIITIKNNKMYNRMPKFMKLDLVLKM
ncbi:unnamed protein product [Prunus brigantina]